MASVRAEIGGGIPGSQRKHALCLWWLSESRCGTTHCVAHRGLRLRYSHEALHMWRNRLRLPVGADETPNGILVVGGQRKRR